MAMFISKLGGQPERLSEDWLCLKCGPVEAAVRAYGRGALLENRGDQALVVEVRAGGIWESAELQPGESSMLPPGSRFHVGGQQAATQHKLEAMAFGDGPGSPAGAAPAPSPSPAAAAAADGAASGGAAAAAGGSKRPGSGGSAAAAAGEAAKRQRVASGAAAGPSGAGADPSSRLPDAPMHLMAVRGIPDWANEGFLGVRLADLVRGDMRWCLVSNYMVDLRWLLSACPDLARAGRLVLVHGEHPDRAAAIGREMAAAGLASRTTVHAPPLPIQFGTHHSKAFLIEYERGLRVVVFTANAIHPDCNNKSQGLFWQDFGRKDAASPESSAFQDELERYVRELRLPLPEARHALGLLAAHDFSAARAHLVASVPGYHTGAAMHRWGHLRLRALLNREPPFPCAFAGTPLAAQFSSLGSLDEAWLLNEFLASLAAGRCGDGSARLGSPASGPAGLQLVWPTAQEVQNSLEGWFAGRSIPGPEKNVGKPFLQHYWHRWGGAACGRQRAGPHIKSYCRYLPGGDVAWLYVGSHNLSKAAWGTMQKKGTQLMCRSYELGVILTPATEAAYRASRWAGFSCTADAPAPAAAAGAGGGGEPPAVRFVAWQRGASQEAQAGADGALRVPLPIPYSLPPQRYAAGDRPWVWDVHFPGVDSLGCTIDSSTGRMYGLLE